MGVTFSVQKQNTDEKNVTNITETARNPPFMFKRFRDSTTGK